MWHTFLLTVILANSEAASKLISCVQVQNADMWVSAKSFFLFLTLFGPLSVGFTIDPIALTWELVQRSPKFPLALMAGSSSFIPWIEVELTTSALQALKNKDVTHDQVFKIAPDIYADSRYRPNVVFKGEYVLQLLRMFFRSEDHRFDNSS